MMPALYEYAIRFTLIVIGQLKKTNESNYIRTNGHEGSSRKIFLIMQFRTSNVAFDLFRELIIPRSSFVY
jgi:hypothetical protein